MPFNVGPMELVIVLVIALIVLGPKRLPEVGPLDRPRHARVQGLASAATRRDDDDDEYAPLERTHRQVVAGTPSANVGLMRISRELLDDVIAHARDDAPNECCGMIASRDGEAVAVHRARNAAASPLRYEIDGMEQYKIQTAIEDAGLELGAIYHSHTRSDAAAVADRHQPRASIPRRCT